MFAIKEIKRREMNRVFFFVIVGICEAGASEGFSFLEDRREIERRQLAAAFRTSFSRSSHAVNLLDQFVYVMILTYTD